MTNIVPLPPRGVDVNDREQVALIKRTLVPEDITDDEFALFLRVANHTCLDPFRRQIYAIKRQGKLTIMTGIDGYRAIANRTGQHAGTDDTVFTGLSKNKQYPGVATVTVYKVVAGMRVPFSASTRWEEMYPGDGGSGTVWRKMPHGMLGKTAEALALRRAFPEELAGVYVDDEMMRDVQDRTIRPDEPPKGREDILGERYQALSVNDKVAYTAWTKTEKIGRPYDDEALDRLEAKLDEIEGVARRPVPRSEDLPECELCGSGRTARVVVDGVVRCSHAKDCAERAAKRADGVTSGPGEAGEPGGPGDVESRTDIVGEDPLGAVSPVSPTVGAAGDDYCAGCGARFAHDDDVVFGDDDRPYHAGHEPGRAET